MYINKLTNQYPVSEQEIRAQYPNTSFSVPFQAPDDYAYVFPSPAPAHDAITEAVRQVAPTLTEKGHYEQQWEVFALSDEQVAANLQAGAERKLAIAKQQRQLEVESIKVTTSAGNEFDGDEVSQTRMARAILAMQATSTPTIQWVLTNNTPAEVTLAELTEALALAGAEQASIWVRPYQ